MGSKLQVTYRSGLQQQQPASVKATSTVQWILTAIFKLYSNLPDTNYQLSRCSLGWAAVSSGFHGAVQPHVHPFCLTGCHVHILNLWMKKKLDEM